MMLLNLRVTPRLAKDMIYTFLRDFRQKCDDEIMHVGDRHYPSCSDRACCKYWGVVHELLVAKANILYGVQ